MKPNVEKRKEEKLLPNGSRRVSNFSPGASPFWEMSFPAKTELLSCHSNSRRAVGGDSRTMNDTTPNKISPSKVIYFSEMFEKLQRVSVVVIVVVVIEYALQYCFKRSFCFWAVVLHQGSFYLPVWPVLAKFCHLGIKLNNFGHFERVHFVSGKILNIHTLVNFIYFGHISSS